MNAKTNLLTLTCAVLAAISLAGCGNQTPATPEAAKPTASAPAASANPVAGWVYRYEAKDGDVQTITFSDERTMVDNFTWEGQPVSRTHFYRVEGNVISRIGSGSRVGELIDGGQRLVEAPMGLVYERVGRVK